LQYAAVPALRVKVRFESRQKIAEVAAFCHRLLDEVLDLKGVDEVRIYRANSKLPIDGYIPASGGMLSFDIAAVLRPASTRPAVRSPRSISFTISSSEIKLTERTQTIPYTEKTTVKYLLTEVASKSAKPANQFCLYQVTDDRDPLIVVPETESLEKIAGRRLRVEPRMSPAITVVVVISRTDPRPTPQIFRCPVKGSPAKKMWVILKQEIGSYFGKAIADLGVRRMSDSIDWSKKPIDNHTTVFVTL
jgi:hypothetical protein